MFFRKVTIVLILSASFTFASNCSAYPAGAWKLDSASALHFEQVWLDMLKQKNVTALDCMLAPEFKDTSREGALRPKEQVLRELPKRQSDFQQTLADLSVDLFGDNAVVRGVNVISSLQGHEVLRIRFTDVLHFSHGRWHAVAAQETDVH